jgi:hypothetical protein
VRTLTAPAWCLRRAALLRLTAVGIVLALALIAAPLPLLRRITGPEAARSESSAAMSASRVLQICDVLTEWNDFNLPVTSLDYRRPLFSH